MKKILLLLFSLTSLIVNGQWNQLGTDIDGQAVNEQSGTTTSLNANGTILAIGAPRAMVNAVMKGKVSIFEWNGTSWIQKGNDILGSNEGDVFGESLNISSDGNIIVIGASGSLNPAYLSPTGPTGYARVFEWNGSNWSQKGSDIQGTAPNDIAGSSVSINASGNSIGMSIPGFDGANGANCGAIRNYDWNGTAWIQKGQDVLGSSANSYLGTLAMNATGNIIAIGNGGDNTGGSNAGSVKVFEFNGATWTQKGNTVLGNNAALQGHGSTLAIDDTGTNFITGGYSFTNGALGYIKAYTWNGTSWIPKGVTLPGTGGSDFFGTAVDISQDGSIIAASSLTLLNGYVRFFKFEGSSWTQQGTDLLGEASGDQFGRSLSLSSNGSILAAGTPFNDGNGTSAGHVRVFENTTLSTSDFDSNSFSFYPNPAKDIVTFSTKNSIKEIIIYNLLGQEVLTKLVNSNDFSIDISNLSVGTYIAKLNQNGKSKSIKLVKM